MIRKSLILVFVLIFSLSSICLVAQGKTTEQISKDAAKLMKKGNKSLNAAAKEASAEKKEKKFTEALDLFKQVMELEPEFAEPYFQSARILVTMQKEDDAVQSLHKAIEIQPSHLDAKKMLMGIYINQAKAMMGQRDMEKASEIYEKVFAIPGLQELNPQVYIRLCFQLGMNYFQMKENEKSNVYLGKFIATPESKTDFANYLPGAVYAMGNNYHQLKDIENSNKYFLQYLQLVGSKPVDQFTVLANFYIGQNNFSKVEKETDAINKDQTIKDAEAKKAKIQAIAKAAVEVEPYLTKVIELKLDNSSIAMVVEQAHVLLGNYYYLRGDIDKAISTYKTIIDTYATSQDVEKYKKFLADMEKLEKTKK